MKLPPADASPEAQEAGIGRRLLDKTFTGDLEATSKGEMLAFRSSVEGSAGYVALERVTGTLGDKRGSFVLQHFGMMDRGTQRLVVEVVPDSADGELVGLRGTLAIAIAPGGAHSYDFEYEL